jgi:hypothetical protein
MDFRGCVERTGNTLDGHVVGDPTKTACLPYVGGIPYPSPQGLASYVAPMRYSSDVKRKLALGRGLGP